MIRLAVLDVDGTITDRERRLSMNSVEALRIAQNSGLTVSLVSGNVLPVMYGLKVFIGLNGPVFGENGGTMLKDNEASAFFSMDRPREFIKEISKTTSVREIFTNRWRESSMGFEMESKDVDSVSRAAEESGLDVVNSGYSWHALNPGQNKGFAVEVLIEMYGLKYEEVLVCGDSDNDISMFSKPVIKATMANGTANLKKMSDYVSEKSFGDGLVDILRHYSLI
jgi:phosphoglycolate phosphatase (TIGR01487 family)